MSLVPLLTDESIAHPVTALQGFPASVDKYKFKAEWYPKLDPVTGAMELQYRFMISTLKSTHATAQREAIRLPFSLWHFHDMAPIIFITHSLSAGRITEQEWNIHNFVCSMSWMQKNAEPPKLTARFLIVFIDLASLIKRGNRESCEREHSCWGKAKMRGERLKWYSGGGYQSKPKRLFQWMEQQSLKCPPSKTFALWFTFCFS